MTTGTGSPRPRTAASGCCALLYPEPVTALADPALIRRLDVGQVAYIYRGGVTFVQVKRLIAAPAALAGARVPDHTPPPAGAAHRAAPPRAPGPTARGTGPQLPHAVGVPVPPATPAPDVTALLDEAFGPEPG